MKHRFNKRLVEIEHAKTLEKMYNLIKDCMEELGEYRKCKELTEEQKEHWRQNYGDKETVVSMLLKIQKPLEKVIFARSKHLEILYEIEEEEYEEPLTPNQYKRLENYFKKVQARGGIYKYNDDYKAMERMETKVELKVVS